MARDIGNVDQLRDRIDSGSTGEKVDYPDPAAAPLGTDAEAGGVSPTKAEIAVEAKALKGARKHARGSRSDPGLMLYLGLIVPVMAAFLLLVGVTS